LFRLSDDQGSLITDRINDRRQIENIRRGAYSSTEQSDHIPPCKGAAALYWYAFFR
jgi:hypothetical protein